MKKHFTHQIILIFSILIGMCPLLSKAQTWEITDFNNLTPTDVFMIVDVNSQVAMPNTANTNSATAAIAVILNSDNTAVISDVEDNLKWNISEPNSDGYIFYPDGTTERWLYCTNSNNGVRVGTGENSRFTLHETNWLKNTGTNRYVGVYVTNPDWRCYTNTTGNISNTQIRFFRLSTTPSTVSAPTFTPGTGTYYNPLTVTLASTTEGAEIRYTTDGTEPNGTSALYSSPLTISGTTTLKAIACTSTDTSHVATATYTFPAITDVNTISDLRSQAADNSTLYRLTGSAIVTLTASNRNHKYLQDATAGILIDDQPGHITTPYVAGDEITGIIGTLTIYNNLLEFQPVTDPGDPVSSGNSVSPIILTLDEISTTYEAMLVTVENVTIQANVDTFEYNKFYNLNEQSTVKVGAKYIESDLIGMDIPVLPQNITGVIYTYNSTFDIIPRNSNDVTPASSDCMELPTLNPVTTDLADRALNLHSSVAATGDFNCTVVDYGFVYSLTNPSPEISGEGCTQISLGNSIGTNEEFVHALDVLGFEPYYICAYATNNVGTAYSEVTTAYPAEPETYNVYYNVANISHYGDTPDTYTEGQPALTLQTLTDCPGGDFIGWSTSPIPTSTDVAPEVFTTLVPTQDTELYAVFATGDITADSIRITRESFTGESTSYGTDDAWSAVSAQGTTIDGWFDLYCPTNDRMQTNSNSANSMPYNETELPGSITEIRLTGGARGTARTWTPYVSTTPLNKDNYSEDGISLGGQTAVDNTASTQWEVPADAGYRYFYLDMTGGAAYLSEILITYQEGNLHYTSFPSDTISVTQAICEGQTFQSDFFNESEAGDYEYMEQNGYCTTYHLLHLDVNAPDTTHIYVDTCGSFTYEQTDYTTSTEFTVITPAESTYGCDSVTIYHINIRDTYEIHLDTTVCDVFQWEGEEYHETQLISNTLTAANGCDSVVYINLTVNQSVLEELYDTVCAAPYSWTWRSYNMECYTSGDYTLSGFTAENCTETAILHLTIGTPNDTAIHAAICSGDVYTENGFNVSEEGTYSITHTNAQGCDSVVTLYLTILQPATYEFSDSQCESYTWNEQIYDQSGDYTQTFIAANGCDSIVTLHLIIHQPVSTEIHAQICDGESYQSYNFNETEQGTYYQHLTTENFCDSTVILYLTVGNEAVTHISDQTCEGTAYTNNGFQIDNPAVGTTEYQRVIERPGTCDSIVNLTLTVHPVVNNEFSDSGCESYTWNNQIYNQSNDYTQAFTASNGCDSVVTLHLTILQPVTYEFSDSGCESYTWNDQIYNQSDDYTQTFTAANGCDSVVTLHLTIHSSTVAEDTLTICESELPFTWNDIVFTEARTDSVVLTTTGGCDSLVIMTLNVTHINTEVEVMILTSTGGEIHALQDGAEYQWINCDNEEWIAGATEQSFTPDANGNYACIITYNGCVDTTECNFIPVGISETPGLIISCYPNPADNQLTIQANRIQEVQLFNTHGQLIRSAAPVLADQLTLETASLVPGTYIVQVITAEGTASQKVIIRH